jgi:hypothetical protein
MISFWHFDWGHGIIKFQLYILFSYAMDKEITLEKNILHIPRWSTISIQTKSLSGSWSPITYYGTNPKHSLFKS